MDNEGTWEGKEQITAEERQRVRQRFMVKTATNPIMSVPVSVCGGPVIAVSVAL